MQSLQSRDNGILSRAGQLTHPPISEVHPAGAAGVSRFLSVYFHHGLFWRIWRRACKNRPRQAQCISLHKRARSDGARHRKAIQSTSEPYTTPALMVSRHSVLSLARSALSSYMSYIDLNDLCCTVQPNIFPHRRQVCAFQFLRLGDRCSDLPIKRPTFRAQKKTGGQVSL